jgi:peptidoglycan-associated lipoprotein
VTAREGEATISRNNPKEWIGMKKGIMASQGRRAVVFAACLLVASGALLTGCGGKQKIETRPEEIEPLEDEGEELDRPVVPEATEEGEERAATLPDYASLQPSDYGVEDVFFEFDSSTLTPETMDILAQNARILREADVPILIEGHCDERGTVEYNLALGERRANSVRDYLISLGVPTYRLETVSYGESRPFATGHNERAWALNRRGHFTRP